MVNFSLVGKMPTVMLESLKMVFEEKKYYAITIISATIALAVYTGLPIYTIPGNTFEIFLATTTVPGLMFMLFLSILIGILVSMQVYAFKNNLGGRTKEITTSFTAFISSIIGAIFTSATCALCVGSIFGFLGAGGIILLLEHKTEISIIAFFLVISSLYLTSVRIYDCNACRVTSNKPAAITNNI